MTLHKALTAAVALIALSCGAALGGNGAVDSARITEVLNYVMERKTLRSFKRLAERDAAAAQRQPA